jgi:molybdopterin converting factor small subunit
MRKELLDANENFLPHMKFFINGREVVYLPDKFDTVIQPEDKVDIFPPVGGG